MAIPGNRSNIPNLITTGRFALVPVVVLLLITDASWAGFLAMVCIVLAGISDVVDGYLARKWGSESDVGKLLDPVADKVLIVAALTMMVGLGRVHPILVVILVSREILITGLRAVASSKNLIIPAAISGKYKTTFQLISIGALALHRPVMGLDAHLVGLISLYISLGFSLYSAVEYVLLFVKELKMKLIY